MWTGCDIKIKDHLPLVSVLFVLGYEVSRIGQGGLGWVTVMGEVVYSAVAGVG